jgi:hypothetical protein
MGPGAAPYMSRVSSTGPATCVRAPTPPIKGTPLLRPDGRLTDAGIDALYADFAAARLTNRQIAAKFPISLSGVVKRKAMWRRGER